MWIQTTVTIRNQFRRRRCAIQVHYLSTKFGQYFRKKGALDGTKEKRESTMRQNDDNVRTGKTMRHSHRNFTVWSHTNIRTNHFQTQHWAQSAHAAVSVWVLYVHLIFVLRITTCVCVNCEMLSCEQLHFTRQVQMETAVDGKVFTAFVDYFAVLSDDGQSRQVERIIDAHISIISRLLKIMNMKPR